MFILFTTSNNPDVWVPAYKSSRWSSLFFIVYVLLGVYFLTNLILAVIYDSFKEQLAKQVSQADCTRKSILEKAFGIIDATVSVFHFMLSCKLVHHNLATYFSASIFYVFLKTDAPQQYFSTLV